MEDQKNLKIEYRFIPVKRWIVTRHESNEWTREDGVTTYSGGSESYGEFDNESQAYKVANALCKSEHKALGWPDGDGRIKYPEHPDAIRDPAPVKRS